MLKGHSQHPAKIPALLQATNSRPAAPAAPARYPVFHRAGITGFSSFRFPRPILPGPHANPCKTSQRQVSPKAAPPPDLAPALSQSRSGAPASPEPSSPPGPEEETSLRGECRIRPGKAFPTLRTPGARSPPKPQGRSATPPTLGHQLRPLLNLRRRPYTVAGGKVQPGRKHQECLGPLQRPTSPAQLPGKQKKVKK